MLTSWSILPCFIKIGLRYPTKVRSNCFSLFDSSRARAPQSPFIPEDVVWYKEMTSPSAWESAPETPILGAGLGTSSSTFSHRSRHWNKRSEQMKAQNVRISNAHNAPVESIYTFDHLGSTSQNIAIKGKAQPMPGMPDSF